MRKKVFYPGSTIGFIGNGANMINFVLAAINFGFKTSVLTTDMHSTLESIADYYYSEKQITTETLLRFANQCDFVIYVSDLLNSDIIKKLANITNVPQGSEALEIREDRLIERTFLEDLNVNLLPYETAVDLKDVYNAVDVLGYPIIIKPIQRGINDDRQLIIRNQTDIVKASLLLEYGTYMLEAYLDKKIDIEIIASRDLSGEIHLSPAIQCKYQDGMLISALVPAKVDPDIEKELDKIAQKIADNVSYEGLMRINFILSKNNIYVKSLTPFLNLSGLVLKYSGFDQYDQLIKASAGVSTVAAGAVNPCVLQTFNFSQLSKIRLQWALKDEWNFRFYRNPNLKIAGYISIPTESIDNTLRQIEATGVWEE